VPRFYLGLSLVFAAIAFVGFAPTYVLPVVAGRAEIPAAVHVHGLFFFAWTVLLVVQARLARSTPATHRALGLVGISLATAMFFMGIALVVRGLILGIEAGNGENTRALAIVPVFGITTFAVFFALAVANVRRPEVHKRLIVLATVSLLSAPFARMLRLLFAANAMERPEFNTFVGDIGFALNAIIVPALLADSLLIGALVYDWRTRGRPHKVYVLGGLCILGAQALRPLIARTDAWHAVTDFLVALAR
jgi:hypothetical protein